MSTNFYLALLAGTALAASPAMAEETGPAPAPPVTAQQATDLPPLLDLSAALSDDELDGLRGGEALIITDQTLIAITTGNVITGDYVAGNVTLSDYSLSNFNGVGNLLINTGAQNSLQSGMNLTVNVGP